MASALGNVRLDKKDVAADGSPGQSNHDPSALHALFDFLLQPVFRSAEEFHHHIARHQKRVALAFEKAPGLFPADAGNFALEITDARLPRVMARDHAQRVVFKLNLLGFQATVVPSTG